LIYDIKRNNINKTYLHLLNELYNIEDLNNNFEEKWKTSKDRYFRRENVSEKLFYHTLIYFFDKYYYGKKKEYINLKYNTNQIIDDDDETIVNQSLQSINDYNYIKTINSINYKDML